jgi:hypothetical protein
MAHLFTNEANKLLVYITCKNGEANLRVDGVWELVVSQREGGGSGS